MGKLGQDDFMESTEALKDFKLDCIGQNGYNLYANIEVLEDDEKILELEDVEVLIALNFDHHHIDIMWENVLDDYKRFKLYGRYRTDYNLMEYSYKELIITSDKISVIIRG